MVRELAISLYLFVFRILFNIFKLFPQKKKTSFVTSFGDNVLYTVNALEEKYSEEIVILKTNQCQVDFNDNDGRTVVHFDLSHPFDWVRSIYHLATSRMVFIDNYFGFLAVSRFHPHVTCIQLWHAAGAIKQFGLNDPSNQYRTKRAIDRFHKVYQRFDHVVVGSEKMADIFKESFGLDDDRMLRTGIPRTDFYYEESAKAVAKSALKQAYPSIYRRRVILYAPTFRDNNLESANIKLDIERLYRAFKDDYTLLLRLHPAIQGVFVNEHPEFVVDVSAYPDIHHVLVGTDILITDYSSIPFEFSLLEKPMIFFAYDLDEYKETRGFGEDYEKLVPGPVVKDTDGVIEVIKQDQFDLRRVNNFAQEWNEYSHGDSSKRLIEALYDQEHASHQNH